LLFDKILVANRGEIAVRIIRAARELGIRTAVIYTKEDSSALHAILSDEAYRVSSYISIDEIVDIALKSKADAVHPGYGFLAENPIFASKVVKEGIVFIGPEPEAMILAGNKLESKKAAEKAEVPVIPGPLKPITSINEAERVAEKLGYPILLKAVGGGGGIGMRIVRNRDELHRYFKLAQQEAYKAFAMADVYIEKYIEKPRHIEVQIIADNYGNIIHLYERECSIQRRFQKLVEEAPSKALMWDERVKIASDALRLAEKIGYTNAGTVEFLYKDGRYYFIEINARLQVEHGVTEMVTGIDIVKAQIRIAADKPLNIGQGQVSLKGWAIEVRINAEDPLREFAPTPGKIVKYHEPGGLGVRVDSGVYEGFNVPQTYNPLISKLIVWGESREEAIQRLRRALSEYIIEGIRTTIPLYKKIVNDKDFLEGNIHTKYLDEKLPKFISELSIEERRRIIAAALALREKTSVRRTMSKVVKERRPLQTMSLWKVSTLYGLYQT